MIQIIVLHNIDGGEKGYPSQSVNFGNNRRSGLYSINEDGFTTMGSYSTYNELYYATKYS